MAAGVGDKKKEPNSGEKGGKDDLSATMTSKKNAKVADTTHMDYKAEMEEFRTEINELYQNAAVRLMETYEEQKRD